MNPSDLPKVFKGLRSAGLSEDEAMNEAVRICGSQKETALAKLNASDRITLKSLKELGRGIHFASSVKDNCGKLPSGFHPCYKTVLTSLQRLKSHGLVTQDEHGYAVA